MEDSILCRSMGQMRKKTRSNVRGFSVFLLAVFLSLPVQQIKAEDQGSSKIKETDLSKTVTISVRHADLAEVFEMMSKHGRVNILLANGVSGEVSINAVGFNAR